ncbi:cytochrome b/b6 domain-containing protein [Vibrio profundi]|uniref:cytochrome b/b6 domain-containing protein n=1 Tax=Vibrio profundi TaxID=1774960 RepID=UPI0037366E3F
MKVWDLATRLYHWIQAIVFIALIGTGFTGNGPHLPLGLALFTLITWRILWGFVGSETNRFSQFVRSPLATVRYLRGKQTQDNAAGHNPAGGWMVVALITGLLMQCLSGLALAGMLDNLPFAQWWLTDTLFDLFESIHFILARVLPALVLLHVMAILIYKLKRKPLVKAMFTGFQDQALTKDGESIQPSFVSQRRAFLMLVAAGLVTMTIIASSLV